MTGCKMATPVNQRAKKLQPSNVDPELQKVLEDYSETRTFYDTLELIHPSFNGMPGAVGNSYYLVNHTDKVIRNKITYINISYGLTLPQKGSKQQTMDISIDNIDQLVQKAIEKAIQTPTPIKLVYRVYVEGSADVKVGPITLQTERVSVSENSVTLSCSRPDLFARNFPRGVRYDNRYPGLFV